MGEKPKVFLSYASEDKKVVRRVFEALEQLGCDPWMDKKRLEPGSLWKTDIYQSILAAPFFIACLSPHSVNKISFVQKEFDLALNSVKYSDRPPIRIIPLVLQKCFIPPELLEHHTVWWDEPDVLAQLVKVLCPDLLVPDTFIALLKSLNAGSSTEQCQAAIAIAMVRTPLAFLSLYERFYHEPDAAVRYWLAYRIGSFGTAQALNALQKLREWEEAQIKKAQANLKNPSDFALEGVEAGMSACNLLMKRSAQEG